MANSLVKWTLRILISGVSLLILLAIVGALWQWKHTRETERKYTMPGKLIDVGGHRLHCQRQGNGSPTVVMEAGMAGASYNWPPISTEIAKFAEVFTYDRAGFGWSDQGFRPRTAQQIQTELRILLQKTGVKPPFVLLGYSWGGSTMRLYASLHPEEVAGLILVDSVNYDTAKDNFPFGRISIFHRILASGTGLGTARLALPIVLGMHPTMPNYDIQLDMLSRTKSVETICDELEAESNWLSVRAAMKHLGDMPVTVISRRIEATDNGLGQQWWLRGQKGLLTISNKTKSILAKSSDHGFPMAEPELVVQAVREMVENLRSNRDSASKP